jgi:hypothetical protein
VATIVRRVEALVIVFLAWSAVSTEVARAADPLASLKEFSLFKQADLNRLLDGEILAERGSLMNFPNGISAQTCFAVAGSAEDVAKRLQVWDPSPHRELKVYAFHLLHNPCDLADFKSLSFKSSERPVRWLLDKTLATKENKSELNLSRAEAHALTQCLKTSAEPDKAGDCWAQLLFARASAFQRNGLGGSASYEVAGQTVSPAAQLHSMLLEQLEIAREFLPVLKASGLLPSRDIAPPPPAHYWSFFEADHHATLNLGAVYLTAVGDHYQAMDEEYYVCGNYYTSATLYEIWPIQVGQRTGALVWRGDFFAAPSLSFTKGTERIAYGAIMLQEIKKEIRSFQEDVKAKR